MQSWYNSLMSTIVLFTGLAGSGKSTLAKELAHILEDRKTRSRIINGDDYIKSNFSKEGFVFDLETRSKLDLMIINSVKKHYNSKTTYLIDLGNITESGRGLWKKNFPSVFVVYISTPLFICLIRDIKRSLQSKQPLSKFMYLKSLWSRLIGEKKHLLQGISLPYEKPKDPDIVLDLSRMSIPDAARTVLLSINK